jgi:hypothetical protein
MSLHSPAVARSPRPYTGLGRARVRAQTPRAPSDPQSTALRDVEGVAARLAEEGQEIGPLTTPLTQSKRSSGRTGEQAPRPRRATTAVTLPRRVCQTCGAPLGAGSRTVCNGCLPERRSLAGTIGRRASRSQIGRSVADQRMHRESAMAWDRSNPAGEHNRQAFDEQVRPGLAGVTIAAMVAATGLSPSYCSRIRSGPVTPHPMHWATLRNLVDCDPENAASS